MERIGKGASAEEAKAGFVEATLAELKDIMRDDRGDFARLYRDVPAYAELKLKESFRNGVAAGMKRAAAAREKGGPARKFFGKRS